MTSHLVTTSSALTTLTRTLTRVSGLALALTLSACPNTPGVVHGVVDAIDMREGMLLGGDVLSINGTYGAGCTDRTGSWSVEVDVGAPLDNAALSVVLNDVGCVLTLTEVNTTGGLLAATPSIALGTSYKMSASAFDDPVAFYANAKMDSVSYAADFQITFLFSDDSNVGTDDNTATFEVVEASAPAESVDAPDYTINPDTLLLLTDTDQVVQSVTGNIGLTAGMQTGQTYLVVSATGLDTYAELDAAYTGGSPAALGANIPASAFSSLVGADLDTATKRTLIIANIENDVAAYQAFEITFHPAT